MVRSFDVLGNIAIVNFSKDVKQKEKKKFAGNILKKQKAIKTILEKVGKVKGRLRKPVLKYLAGEKTKEVSYRENDCVFRFNVDDTYFSPRLSNERKEIAGKIKKGDEVLVMFAGVGPFSIVIAKKSKAKKVYSNEINRKANKYAELNIELNKLKERVVLINGDIKKVSKKLSKFDVIVMPRPQLKETFLREAFSLSKKGTRIFYYDFCKENEINLIVEKIQKQAKLSRKKIKTLKIKKAGEIAPYKIRVRVDFQVV
ncbi:MAG: methyltransferase [Nanoarchaeota archaeon]|nr:methyltransferase [Nanoarchaeota archaeon]